MELVKRLLLYVFLREHISEHNYKSIRWILIHFADGFFVNIVVLWEFIVILSTLCYNILLKMNKKNIFRKADFTTTDNVGEQYIKG